MKQKLINLFITACTLYCNLCAQPSVQVQKAFGGTDYDQLVSICKTRDGGFIAGGNSPSNKSYEKSENSRGGIDYWVVKIDKNGKKQWDRTIGGSSDEDFKSVIQTFDGGYALIGESGSNISGEKSQNCSGFNDFWLVKLDYNGNVEWDKTIGGDGAEAIDNIIQTKDGGYILGGSSDSPASGSKSEDSRGFYDYWVIKIDRYGNKVWDKTIGGSDYEFCSPVVITSDGSILMGGFSASNISGEKTENSRGNYDIWLVKLNNKGIILWDKTIGGNGFDGAFGIQKTDDGGYLLSGSSESDISGEKTQNSRGGTDYWLVKINANGKKLWDKTIGGSGDDHQGFGGQFEKTSDGGYILGGTSNSNISGEKTENSRGDYDYWIVKLDKHAKIQWDKTIGGSSTDAMGSIKEIEKNNYLAAGYSLSDISGDKTVFPRGLADFWIVRLKNTKTFNDATSDDNVSVSPLQKSISDQIFTVYPNPAKDILNVHVNGKTTVTLTDQSGKILLTKTINTSSVISISNLPAGLYYLKNITTGETQKIIVY